MRVVMWSSPRSLSTALMRSWARRTDTTVIDEPFYGAWLREQPQIHPGTEKLLLNLETDRHAVAQKLRATGGSPRPSEPLVSDPLPRSPLQYEKHIAHHVTLPFVAREMQGVRHAFLIRHPARQLTSLARVLPEFPFDLAGWPMMEKLFSFLGGGAPTLDADDLGRDPARALRLLCDALSVDFYESMLTWNPGKHPAEGTWAADWYQAVQSSRGLPAPGGPAAPPRPFRASAPDLRADARRASPLDPHCARHGLGRLRRILSGDCLLQDGLGAR